MDFGAMLSVVQSLLATLQCSQLKEICSMLGYVSELDNLSNVVTVVKAVLLDVGAKQELPNEAPVWFQELKDVVYDADDFLDEFVTLAEQKQLLESGEISEEVCLFFSRFSLRDVANNMSQMVEKIREKLATIASNQQQFDFSFDYLPIRRKEGAYFDEGSTIGREDDVSKIVDMLFDTDDQQGVSVFSIVGMAGLGKTVVARLLYNHERVASAFSLRLWTCVSDQDQNKFDVNEILCKILRSQIHHKLDYGSMDEKLDQLIERIAGTKFLLVLDDVWTENHAQWLKLVEFFMAGKRGSWIVVTTRSRKTAKVIRNGPTYELQGLSEEDSWCLFERMAFGQATPSEDLVKIAREIVKGCTGVPLAIRVVGSLVYGQDKSNWLALQEMILANIRNSKNNNVMPLLKLSYHHLNFPLQSCFSYCALFPKDFEIEKEMLINLWIAQGYVVPLDETQSVEDASEEYFSVLLRRGFFQDAKIDYYGEIVSCKIPSLMHDIAQEIAGKEICTAYSFNKTRLRTYFQVNKTDQFSTDQLLKNWICLRALVLRDSGIESLPDSIGKLLHLRFLDLSDNSRLEVLPKSITNLHNLQTLVLRICPRLKELPKDLSKLVKLKVLDISYSKRLTSLPLDLWKLTCLHSLSNFKVEVSSCLKKSFDQLEGLKALKNLKGDLVICIRFHQNAEYIRQDGMEGSYVRNKNHLNYIAFSFEHVETDARVNCDETLLEDLQPHSNLRGLMFYGYHGVRMPSWARADSLATFLPNLVRLVVSSCQNLQYLPNLGNLNHLKFLSFYNLPSLEYIDGSVEEASFFPCLEELCLYQLSNLKQWRKGEVVGDDLLVDGSSKQSPLLPSFPCFPLLKFLSMHECQNFTSVLLCPRIEDILMHNFNRKLQISMTSNSTLPRLCSLNTGNIVWYKSLPTAVFQSLTRICIYWDKELKSLSQVEEIFQSCSSSLKTLTICHSPELRNLSGGLEHLTVLETLFLENIPNLSTSPEEEESGMPWRCLHQSLRSLELREVPKLVNLPSGMQYLTNLHILRILYCGELQSLPEWLQKLTSLRQLEVHGCSDSLYDRCQYPNGEDYSYIQHIPRVSIR